MSRPPTERQLAYLKRLGYKGEPPTTAHKVSAAIDALLRQRRTAQHNVRMQNQMDDARNQPGNSRGPHWLNSKTGIRHNSECRLYRNTLGHLCSADEGQPCGICGG